MIYIESTDQESINSKEHESRERILIASIHLFSMKGYHGATMRQISNEAGVSPGLAYLYFKSKEGLIREIVSGCTGNLLEVMKGQNNRRSLLELLKEELQQHRDAFRILYGLLLQPESVPGLSDIILGAYNDLREVATLIQENESETFPENWFLTMVFGVSFKSLMEGGKIMKDIESLKMDHVQSLNLAVI